MSNTLAAFPENNPNIHNSRFLKRYSGDYLNHHTSNVHKVFIESHRGVSKEEPENTILAFEKAILIGCDSIEMDIWLTKDKIPIVIHGDDDGCLHVDSKKSFINSLTLEEISKVNLEKNQKIPSLYEVFKICKYKIFLNLELKDPNYEETFSIVTNLINYFDMKNEVQVSSFNHSYWNTIEKNGHSSYIEFGFLYDKINKKIDNFDSLKLGLNPYSSNSNYKSMLNLWYGDVNEEIVMFAHINKMAVLAYFGMDDEETPEIINDLIKFKIDVICTNDPRNAIRIRDEYYLLNNII
jgi:glycerophosphoryl diester phosphodiesterase